MVQEGSTASASEPERETIESKPVEIGNDAESFFSPRFKSAAAMAGWDEEALLIASLVVDDTPEREFRQKKRCVLQCKSPPSGSRRKRRTSTSLISIPVAVLDLDEEELTVKDDAPKQDEEKAEAEPKKSDPSVEQKADASSLSSCSTLPCMDKLREELSCAICLEICFEPSTTPCGHSFCKKCLRSAADKCGKKCPKCRQLISNGRSCTVNTVLWNTIQLLFPQEVEARKEAKGCSSHEKKKVQDPEKAFYSSLQNHNTRATGTSSRHGSSSSRRREELTVRDEDGESNRRMTQQAASSSAESRVQSRMHHRRIRPVRTTRDADVRSSSRRGTPDQDQDAALALRLQREEFMEAFRDTQVQTRSSLSLARANLRAMASRAAINLRINGRRDL